MLLLAVLGTIPARDSHAKAKTLFYDGQYVEAIIYHVDVSSEAGDTDLNILLRPASAGKAEEFWQHFWPYAAQDWIDNALAPALIQPGQYGEACKQCAGRDEFGTKCKITAGTAYPKHPCPRLFSCKPCLDDFKKWERNVSDLTVKAEVFVDRPGGINNELNGTLASAVAELGFSPQSCNEGDGQTDSLCGHSVWVSGFIALDEMHGSRMELHPLQRIVIDRGLMGDNTRRFSVGAFIDGSSTPTLPFVPGLGDEPPWMADYHKLVQMQSAFTFDTSQAPFTQSIAPHPQDWQPIVEFAEVGHSAVVHQTNEFVSEHVCMDPIHKGIAKAQEEIDALNRDIAAEQKARDHTDENDTGGSPSKSTSTSAIIQLNEKKEPYLKEIAKLREDLKKCPPSGYRKISVSLNDKNIGGAYWVGDARIGWMKPESFDMKVSRLGNLAGYLSVNPPDVAHLPREPNANCFIPAVTKKDSKLKRWFGWKVKTSAKVKDKHKPTWKWTKPSEASVLVPQPPANVPNGDFEFVVWMPAPSYAGTLKGIESDNSGTSFQVRQLKVTPPRTRIVDEDGGPSVDPKKPGHVMKVQAQTLGLCGDSSGWTFAWTLDGVPVPEWKGPGPHTATLEKDTQALVEVVVQDALGVEKVDDARVLIPPSFAVIPYIECSTTAGKPGNVRLERLSPRGWPAPKPGASSTLCLSTKVGATSLLVLGDEVLATPSPATYKWADLKIATEDDGWTWREVPATWKVTYPDASSANQSVVITPDKPGYFEFQASVTATDAAGGTATANVTGSNDTTSPTELKPLLAKLWATWRPNTPVPTGKELRSSADPLTRKFAAVTGYIDRVKPDDTFAAERARGMVRDLYHFGFEVVGKQKNIVHARPKRPVFTVKATKLPQREELNAAARATLRSRLKRVP